jgi:hypothetical protein
MTVKQTDRVQIESFGTRGRELFDQIEGQLKTLVINVAGVNYEGANAFEFKTACTNYTVDFANVCNSNMQNISQTITNATSYIAQALGGQPISLDPPTVAVESPAINADTSVETAEDGPLLTLRDTVTTNFNAIESCFNENLSNFQSLGVDGWIGPEYDAALDDVTLITTKASEEVTAARTTIANAINAQLQALGMGA